MCLAIPGRILSVNGTRATIDVLGNSREADLSLVDDTQPGDYVLVHAGFAIQKINPQDAEETLRTFKEIGEILDEE